MNEEVNDKLKLHISATSTPTPNITKLKTVTSPLPPSLLAKGCGCTDTVQEQKNAIHSIEKFKVACK